MNKNHILFGLLFSTACLYSAQPLELALYTSDFTRAGGDLITEFYPSPPPQKQWDSLTAAPVSDGPNIGATNIKYLFTALSNIADVTCDNDAGKDAVDAVGTTVAGIGDRIERYYTNAVTQLKLRADKLKGFDDILKIKQELSTIPEVTYCQAHALLYCAIAQKIEQAASTALKPEKERIDYLYRMRHVDTGFKIATATITAGYLWLWYTGRADSSVGSTIFDWTGIGLSALLCGKAFMLSSDRVNLMRDMNTSYDHKKSYFDSLVGDIKGTLKIFEKKWMTTFTFNQYKIGLFEPLKVTAASPTVAPNAGNTWNVTKVFADGEVTYSSN